MIFVASAEKVRPVETGGPFSRVDWDKIPDFLKLPGYTPPQKNRHGLTLADVPAWLHESGKPHG